MERLTQWIDENRAIPRVDLRRCGHERCTTQLARYEDTGLTPDQIMELVERDTAKAPIKDTDSGMRYTDDYICPNCGRHFTGTGISEFCYHCGQRLKWEDWHVEDIYNI